MRTKLACLVGSVVRRPPCEGASCEYRLTRSAGRDAFGVRGPCSRFLTSQAPSGVERAGSPREITRGGIGMASGACISRGKPDALQTLRVIAAFAAGAGQRFRGDGLPVDH